MIVVAAMTLVLPSWGQSAAAAENGSVSDLTLEPSQLRNGSTGNLRFAWSFPAGSTTGDTITIDSAADFALSNPSAFPDGQPIYDANNVEIARITVVGNVITVTRVVDASWGDLSSVEVASVPFSYSGDILAGEERTTLWPSTNGDQEIAISGVSVTPAWYGPRKQGSFFFSSTGEPMIRWSFFSPIGLQEANSVTLSDVVGPGQELVCSSIAGTIRRWDQSYPDGRDSWVSGFDSSAFECDTTEFSGVITEEIPAPAPGGNEDVAIENRPENVAYLQLNYETRVTDTSLASSGWTNTMNWQTTEGSQAFNGTVRFPGSATGNRLLTVSKTVTGPESLSDGRAFVITVSCDTDGQPATGFPQQVELRGGQQVSLYPPIGSNCAATEEDAFGADVTTNGPVAITAGLEDRFSLEVTNDFSKFEVTPVAPTVTQAVCVALGEASAPSVVAAEEIEGLSYSVDGDQVPGSTVTVTASLAEGYVWPETLPEAWVVAEDGDAVFTVVLAEIDCTEEVTPVAPTVTQAVCVALGEASAPSVVAAEEIEGLSYSVDGDQVPGSTVTVTASLAEGYVWPETLPEAWVVAEDGDAVFTVVLAEIDCTEEVTPVAPTVTQAVCVALGEASAPSVVAAEEIEGLSYSVDGDQVPGSTVTVTASLAEGYVWPETLPEAWVVAEDGDAVFTVVLAEIDCTEEVTPVAPTVTQAVCVALGEASAPSVVAAEEIEGLSYSVDGDQVPGSTVTVTASLAEGYVWPETLPEAWVVAEDGDAVFTVVLAEIDCTEEVTPRPGEEPEPGSPAEETPGNGALPQTGASASLVPTWAALILLFAGCGVLYLSRRVQRQ